MLSSNDRYDIYTRTILVVDWPVLSQRESNYIIGAEVTIKKYFLKRSDFDDSLDDPTPSLAQISVVERKTSPLAFPYPNEIFNALVSTSTSADIPSPNE